MNKILFIALAAIALSVLPAATSFAQTQAFGDSITANHGASPAAASYVNLFALSNQGVSNTQAGDMSNRIRALVTSFDASKKYTLMIGTNDHRVYKADATKQEFFKRFLRNSVAWLSLENKKMPRVSGDITFTGTWSNASGNAINKYTQQQNATATTTVTGTSVYIGYIIQNFTGSDSVAEIRIDGNLVGTIGSYGVINTSGGSTYADAAVRFDGLSAGSHTVEITVTSSGKNFYLNYIAGNNNSGGQYPKIALSNVIRMTAGGYSTHGSSDAIVDQYNVIVDDLVAEFVADGFDVTLVDNHTAVNPATDITSDGVHPNNSGHLKIHNNFAAVLY